MELFSDYFERRRQRKIEEKEKEVREDANTFYQVKEYNGEIWLTYDGNLICPVSMLKEGPVESLNKIRAYYMVRNKL